MDGRLDFWGNILLIRFIVLVLEFEFVLCSVLLDYLLYERIVCSHDVKYVILSSVKNIRNQVSLWLINKDPRSFGIFVSLIYICLRKLKT